MKLPVIRQVQRTCSPEQIEASITVLENLSEAATLNAGELDVIGELISNLCGAMEVHTMIENGMEEKDAVNTFMKKVMGSIDR